MDANLFSTSTTQRLQRLLVICGLVFISIDYAMLQGLQAHPIQEQSPDLKETPELAFYQGSPAPPNTSNTAIDVPEAIQLAIANDPGFQEITWAIEKAKGDQRQATRYPNPTIGVISNEIGNEGGGGQYGVYWSRNLVRNNRPSIQNRYFSIGIAGLQQQFDIRRWQVSRDIGTRILSISRYREQFKVIAVQIEALEQVLKISQKLFAAGEIANIAVTNIELEIDRLRQDQVELTLDREYARRAICVPLGRNSGLGNEDSPPEFAFDWRSTMNDLMDPTSTALSEAWLATHPQINFAEAQVEQSRVQIELARSKQCPDLKVQAAINYDTYTESAFGGFQIGVPFQKYDRKRGLITAANAEYQRRIESVRLTKMRLQSAYILKEGKIARLRSRVNNIRHIIIPKANENLNQIRSAFEVGEAEYLLLRTGLQAVREARLELVEREYELAVAAIDLSTLLLNPQVAQVARVADWE